MENVHGNIVFVLVTTFLHFVVRGPNLFCSNRYYNILTIWSERSAKSNIFGSELCMKFTFTVIDLETNGQLALTMNYVDLSLIQQVKSIKLSIYPPPRE